MYKIFDTLEQYNQFTDNGTHLTAGILYIVKENKSLYFLTNNIDGEAEKYEYLDEIPEGYIIPTGNIEITENGENINVNDYATASVNVPIPEGYIKPSGNKTITQNGTNIDVNDYATATVNVTPNLTTQNITENGTYQPSGNYDGFSSVTVNVPQPTGNISITENGENIDIAQYATATVNVAGSGGNEDLINLIERNITTFNIPSGTTAIGGGAFESCSSLTSVTIPNSVTRIDNNAFQYCSRLTSVTIPDSVTSIGSGVFSNCMKLTSVTIGSGVTSIDSVVFNGCYRLTSVTIEAVTPPTLSSSNAFSNSNNCIIYVPAESLEAYKTATNWSSLSSRLQAIA